LSEPAARLRRLLGALVFLAAACGRPSAPLRPDGFDYVFPAPRAGELSRERGQELEAAWSDVLAGDWRKGEKRLQSLLHKQPGLVPALTGVAYARLRGAQLPSAAATFNAALELAPDYVPALIGAGGVLLRLGEPQSALQHYRRALQRSPDDAIARRRLADVKVQITERSLAASRAARAAGDRETAAAELRRALEAAPEMAELRNQLAVLLVESGDAAGAIAVLESDPTEDRGVSLKLGELLATQNDHARALAVYRTVLARDPHDAEARRRAEAAQRTLELAQMPEEYRRIFEATRLTRADLAALLAVKLKALSRLPQGSPKVATDISGSWARAHILRVLSLDIMDVLPNHTFQPAALVRRGELAAAVAKVLDLFGVPARPLPALRDMSSASVFHASAARVVAAGLMDISPEGAFEPFRVVSGRDAAAVIEALGRLTAP
jgi:tetratricopeptide (TPR) repeat protein